MFAHIVYTQLDATRLPEKIQAKVVADPCLGKVHLLCKDLESMVAAWNLYEGGRGFM